MDNVFVDKISACGSLWPFSGKESKSVVFKTGRAWQHCLLCSKKVAVCMFTRWADIKCKCLGGRMADSWAFCLWILCVRSPSRLVQKKARCKTWFLQMLCFRSRQPVENWKNQRLKNNLMTSRQHSRLGLKPKSEEQESWRLFRLSFSCLTRKLPGWSCQ